jgi:hypothetical protein
MRLFIILSVICAFMFSYAGFARADDVSDLKEQLRALKEQTSALSTKIQELEAKQESQAKEIKKVPELAQKVSDLKESSLGQLTEGLSIGGHLKLFMFDRTQGKRNGESQHTNLSAGVATHAFVLYITKQLTDWLKLDTATDFGVSASATPALGSNLARAYNTTVSTTLRALNLQALLPQGYELKVGIFNPMFSEEFSKETFWHEQYNMNDGLCNLQSWHDSGISLYKNFDFDKWSLPVYLEYLNGASQYVDINEDKMVLLHIAPELFQTKLRLLGSLATGKWDDGDNGLAFFSVGGFDWKYQKFNLTSEYIYKYYGNVTTTGSANADGKKEGYYVRAMYTFNPTWRALVKYSHAEVYKTGSVNMKSDNYDTTALDINYFLTPNSDIIAEYQYIVGDRSDGSDKIRANRFTLGWRTTF